MTGRFGGNSDVGRSWTSVSKYDEGENKRGRRLLQGAGLATAGVGAISLRNSFGLEGQLNSSYDKQKARADASGERLTRAQQDLDNISSKINDPVTRSKYNPMRHVQGPVKDPVKGGPTWQYRDSQRRAAKIKLDQMTEADLKERTRLGQIDGQRTPGNMALKQKTMRRTGGGLALVGTAAMTAPSIRDYIKRGDKR